MGLSRRATAALLPAAALATVLLTASSAQAATGSCDGAAGKVRNAKVIRGGPGDDVLIGGSRDQKVLAGAGNDRVCTGGGNDVVRGGPGDDALHGDGRGDRLFGEAGADRLYGDILDDHLFGGSGDDALLGGHGVDKMYGGEGNDLLRGGTNRDCFYGEGGSNTASFATATPPGEGGSGPTAGVVVDLAAPIKGGCPRRGTGRADDDGAGEALSGIHFVVGSSFDDSLSGAGGAGVDAGFGSDTCAGFAASAGCAPGDEKPPGTFSGVFEPAAPGPPDPGLVVHGDAGAQSLTIAGPVPTTLGYVVAFGGEGADSISVGAGLPPSVTVDLDGGPGNDALTGSDYLAEVLFGGDSPGADRLSGNGGADALVSEGGGTSAGPDELLGGAGDDQLVADYPCAGHSFSGGAGNDVAGFARAGVGIRAKIGGEVALFKGGCPGGAGTMIAGDHEVLEGTPKADRLIGSNRAETLWGREGNDLLIGLGGADDLQGFAGRDLLDARDGRRDRLITCGSGRDRGARVDRADPPARSC